MSLLRRKIAYVVEKREGMLPTCFPEGYDTEDLIEVSTVGQVWATFYNTRTHELVPCEKFYQQYQESLNGED